MSAGSSASAAARRLVSLGGCLSGNWGVPGGFLIAVIFTIGGGGDSLNRGSDFGRDLGSNRGVTGLLLITIVLAIGGLGRGRSGLGRSLGGSRLVVTIHRGSGGRRLDDN
jgi:hypothetical protein